MGACRANALVFHLRTCGFVHVERALNPAGTRLFLQSPYQFSHIKFPSSSSSSSSPSHPHLHLHHHYHSSLSLLEHSLVTFFQPSSTSPSLHIFSFLQAQAGFVQFKQANFIRLIAQAHPAPSLHSSIIHSIKDEAQRLHPATTSSLRHPSFLRPSSSPQISSP